MASRSQLLAPCSVASGQPVAWAAAGETLADVDFALERAGPGRQRILDVPCGLGHHSFELARRGHAVTGIDSAPEVVEFARSTARIDEIDATFLVGDMRELPVLEPFDGAICFGSSVSLLDPQGTLRFFNMVAALLKPSGWLALDSFTCAESLFPLPDEGEIMIAGHWRPARFTYDLHTSTLKAWAHDAAASDPSLLAVHRVMTTSELIQLLASAGLRVKGLFSGPAGAPYRVGDQRLMLFATRSY